MLRFSDRLLLGISFFIPSAPFPPKARGRRGFDEWRQAKSAKDWLSTDIGYPRRSGRLQRFEDGKIFAVDGGGADVWNKACEFQFVHKIQEGDGTIIAQVIGLQHSDPWSKAGLMFRENLLPDSPNIFLTATAENGVSFQWRDTPGAESESIKRPDLNYPCWLRLERKGNTFIGSHSPDGKTWAEIGRHDTVMSENVSIGLGVTSHNTETYSVAEFENVSTE